MIRKILTFVSLSIALLLCSNSQAAELKIGSIDTQKVFYEYNKRKDFQKSLEAKDKKLREEVEKKTQEIRKLRDEIDLLSDNAKAKKEPQLREKIKQFDEFGNQKREEFIREKDEMYKEIRDDILKVSEEYAKKNGYDVIFDKTVFMYSTDKYDVTAPILKELNK